MVDLNGWYFCLRHHEVEHGLGCKAAERMGPYPDQATAERALDISKERNEAADAQRRKWDDDDD
ncbi:hypothetical protein N8J89_08840 [Crossiella sp. CA-258035]|uniref:hypothetical protein n=1 Tax=Crossiella sp. CA-258035 TaxID=2981138 RepID=UPI0024BD37F8|nr:hypothetical protein [Crossiella sp. CA-258035]WHT21153.1 hypothetical protein N8J89_08840 [Crossiella sp. CA-258035]